MSGVKRIAKERQRHMEIEGWTPEHDDAYHNSELLRAALCYVNWNIAGTRLSVTSGMWPWDLSWWKPSDSKIRNLEKAGALIAAEIDRLERAEKQMSYVPADERFLD